MTKFDEMFAEHIQNNSEPAPELFICNEKTKQELNETLNKLNEEVLHAMGVITFNDVMRDLLDGAQVEIRGPWIPYSQEVEWVDFDPDPKSIRRNNHEHR